MFLDRKLKYLIQKITLLLIIFIDGLGMSLVLPLLGELFSQGSYSILDPLSSTWLMHFYYGASLISFSGAMVLGAAVLGQLSDIKGRKWTLYIALFGSILGYLICAVAVYLKMPVIFLFGRLIDGLTAGSIPVAQALLSDLDSRDNKMTSIGLVMFAVTAGYMLGPLIAGIAYFPGFQNLMLPFLFVAGLCVISTLLLSTMHETVLKAEGEKLQIKVSHVFTQLVELFKLDNLRTSLFSFFLFQCAWTLLYQYLPRLTLDGSAISGTHITFVMMEVGIAMCIGFCVIVPRLQKVTTPKKLVNICLSLFCVLAVSFLVFELTYFSLQFTTSLMAVLYTIGYSAMLAYMLSLAKEGQTGLILGSVASICAISASISAFLGSAIASLSEEIFFALLLGLVVASLFLFIYRSKNLKVYSE